MPEKLCQVSPKLHYGSLALHSDPSPLIAVCSNQSGPFLHKGTIQMLKIAIAFVLLNALLSCLAFSL